MEDNIGKVYKVLDLGEIELIDKMGTDLTVVNSARVSFNKRKKELDKRDKILIDYLAENKHHSPFRHSMLSFRIKAPEFVLRQHYKHVIGIETTSSYPNLSHAWNELSLRYISVDEYYIPTDWRAQSEDNKQASLGQIKNQEEAHNLYSEAMKVMWGNYQKLLDLGVAKEQARIVLPLSLYTSVKWTASFQAICNFIELRDHDHAQWEIREYAKVIAKITEEEFPEAYKAWFRNRNKKD